MKRFWPVILLASSLSVLPIALSVSCSSEPSAQDVLKQKIREAMQSAASSVALFNEESGQMDPYVKSKMKGDWLVVFLKKTKMGEDGVYFAPDDATYGTNPALDLSVQAGYSLPEDQAVRAGISAIWENNGSLFNENMKKASYLLFQNEATLSLAYRSRLVGGIEKKGAELDLVPNDLSKTKEFADKFNTLIQEAPSDADRIDELVQAKFCLFTSETIEVSLATGSEDLTDPLTKALSIGQRISLDMDIWPYTYVRDNPDFVSIKALGGRFSDPGDVAVHTARFWYLYPYYGKKLGWLSDNRKLPITNGYTNPVRDIYYEVRIRIP